MYDRESRIAPTTHEMETYQFRTETLTKKQKKKHSDSKPRNREIAGTNQRILRVPPNQCALRAEILCIPNMA